MTCCYCCSYGTSAASELLTRPALLLFMYVLLMSLSAIFHDSISAHLIWLHFQPVLLS